MLDNPSAEREEVVCPCLEEEGSFHNPVGEIWGGLCVHAVTGTPSILGVKTDPKKMTLSGIGTPVEGW